MGNTSNVTSVKNPDTSISEEDKIAIDKIFNDEIEPEIKKIDVAHSKELESLKNSITELVENVENFEKSVGIFKLSYDEINEIKDKAIKMLLGIDKYLKDINTKFINTLSKDSIYLLDAMITKVNDILTNSSTTRKIGGKGKTKKKYRIIR